ncbi:stress-inducible protein [Streptomyces albiflavescens]|uniref:Stress-inducible protein n=1 Tax=Streptomyces albiflavescens TaxID=1623582 RepID=A0A917XQ12_9ACTN|nr:universal stress protein [Streptomyces albiflavescens]GGN48561.1 stress-inducible protein [Streptomyces albiflavescens]
MLKPIVVGLDGSPESVAAASWAAREAVRRGLPLRLVHAWEGLPSDDEPVTLPELQVPQYWARRILRSTLDRVTETCPQLYVSAEQINKPPIAALLAEAEKAELLVLGNQGLGGLSGFFAGSVALASVAQVRQPVVLVRAGWSAADDHMPDSDGRPSVRTPCREVMLAVDPKNDCGAVLDFAFEAAKHRGASLSVIHAWQLLLHSPGGTDQESDASAQRDAESALAQVIAPWREKYPTVEVRAQAHHGRPAPALTRAAQEAGLLIVGRKVRRQAVGSHTGRVAHLAIHHVTCPVAVVAHD